MQRLPAAPKIHRRWASVLALLLALLLGACAARVPAPTWTPPPPSPSPPPASPAPPQRLALLGITIQAGAFARLDNAVGLTETLQAEGLEATFFRDDDGLFKVRFGNFATRKAARQRALALQRRGILDVFYIVVPEDYAAAQRERLGEAFVRQRIVQTARSFLGVPYRWGGTSAARGFDCSGLTMTAYRLNGYDLPRTSRQQFAAGDSIPTDRLQPADLVFFKAPAKRGVSHVGIYIGHGHFIHAPGRGKTIRVSELEGRYYRRHLVGARRFL